MKHIWLLISFLYACLNTFSHPKCNYYFEQIMIADGLSQNHITCIHQDAQGFIWFGTQNGLNKYDGYQIKEYNFSSNDPYSLIVCKIISCRFSRSVFDFVCHQYGICRMYSEENPQDFRLPVPCLYP